MRRLTLVLGAVVLLVGVAGPVHAAPADWAGSTLTTPAETDDATPSITADVVRSYSDTNPATRRLLASTAVTAPTGLPAGCTSALGSTSVSREGTTHHTSADLTTTCNGRYAITITATLERRTCGLLGCGSWSTLDTHELTGTVFVASPPSPVTTTATAPGEGRSVIVTWVPPADAQPDVGYRVERISASGAAVTLADLDGPTTTTYTDAAPPGEGGPTTYLVYATRPGASSRVVAAPSTATADVAADPDHEPDPDEPSTTPSPATPGAGSPGGSSGIFSNPGGHTTSGRASPPVRVPWVGTPSRGLFPSLLAPQVDAGYDDELPFGDREPGEAEAELPNDLAAGAAGDAPGRGLVIPLATGLVFAVWAFHLRFLARVGRPDLVEIDHAVDLNGG